MRGPISIFKTSNTYLSQKFRNVSTTQQGLVKPPAPPYHVFRHFSYSLRNPIKNLSKYLLRHFSNFSTNGSNFKQEEWWCGEGISILIIISEVYVKNNFHEFATIAIIFLIFEGWGRGVRTWKLYQIFWQCSLWKSRKK